MDSVDDVMAKARAESRKKAIEAAVAHGCTLCGRRARFTGVFVPDHPEQWGIPKDRGLAYALCKRCANLPDREGIVGGCLRRKVDEAGEAAAKSLARGGRN